MVSASHDVWHSIEKLKTELARVIRLDEQRNRLRGTSHKNLCTRIDDGKAELYQRMISFMLGSNMQRSYVNERTVCGERAGGSNA